MWCWGSDDEESQDIYGFLFSMYNYLYYRKECIVQFSIRKVCLCFDLLLVRLLDRKPVQLRKGYRCLDSLNNPATLLMSVEVSQVFILSRRVATSYGIKVTSSAQGDVDTSLE
ncbi:hypothetical protein NXS19_008795 [Fusarium pseudograminearum]|nr:hypothetical protein NXS19_008795 [Fusarium pseudograminearum]